jgi:hypothetical protein
MGAILREGDQFWFLKLSGPNEAVADQAESFAEFVRALRFVDDPESPLTWTLPDDWEQQPGDQFRYATIKIPSEETSLDLSISQLPFQGDDEMPYVLSNVNRWRAQLGLSAFDEQRLAEASQRVTLAQDDQRVATIVNFAGEMTESPMRSPRAPRAPVSQAPPAAPADALTYQAPEGWVPGELEIARGGITIRRSAVFEVKQGDQTVEITVTKLPEMAGDTTMNVNRWRQQVALEELPESELVKTTKRIAVGDVEGDYVEILGPQQAILGVIARRQGLAWFIKLQGDRELASQQKESFEAFVNSLQF